MSIGLEKEKEMIKAVEEYLSVSVEIYRNRGVEE